MDCTPNASVNCGVKRKHQSLSLLDKIELLKKLDCGVPVPQVCKIYGIGSSTLYDIKKKREKIKQFVTDCDSMKQINNRKTMKAGKSTELDRVLVEWYRKCRNEGLKLTGNMIMEKAKVFHKELKIEGERDYGKGWLQRFKKRHGMLTAKMCGAKKASNHSGADKDGELEVGADEGEEIAEICSPSSRRTQALEDEILDMVLKDVENRKQDDSDCEDITELLSVEKLIKLTDELIDGLDHCDFMPKQEIIIFHLLLDKLHRERAKQLKQLGLDKTPKKVGRKKYLVGKC